MIKVALIGITILFICKLIYTLKKFPIMKAYTTLESSNAWLTTTILDFYLQLLAFAVIVFSTESLLHASIWVILNCILGSPIAIIYLLTKTNYKLN